MTEPFLSSSLAPAGTVSEAERRTSVRHDCDHLPTVPFLAKPSFVNGLGRLRDLSEEGIGLLVETRIAPGSVLFLHLPGLGENVRLARVVHATLADGGPWHVGCRLAVRLSARQIRQVLAGE